ncbi:MAG: ABC transporter substrate-binding protein [Erysipelotrichaceae bacterium]|nr:ABC transporter substrate-binding protein [Erysipelotrichaceae bacterium]
MKKIIKLILVGAVLLASGCSAKETTTATSDKKDAQEMYGCNVINVYNWGEYIGEDVISNFEEEYNARVNYSLFDSNEEMYTTLLGGNAYDILVPSDYMIERLIQEDMIQPLDKEALSVMDKLDPTVVGLPYDPENTYSVPYFWGSVGIVYNKNLVTKEELDEKGWNILKDTKYAGNIYMYDSERDSFMVALKALGYSMNTEDEAEIQEAYEWLVELHQTMNPGYLTDEVNDAMINEERAMAVVYSGAAAYIMSENENMGYYEPLQGTNIWTDGFVIPSNAKCPGLAHEFINFALSDESMEDSSITVGYTSANKAVADKMVSEGEYFEGNSAYTPRSGYEKDEVFKHNEVLKKKLSELWIKVKVN